MAVDVEAQMTYVERVCEYSNLPAEPAARSSTVLSLSFCCPHTAFHCPVYCPHTTFHCPLTTPHLRLSARQQAAHRPAWTMAAGARSSSAHRLRSPPLIHDCLLLASLPFSREHKRVAVSPPARTAQHGGIAFSHANLRYRPGLPLALRDASFTVRPGDKVGICGRTGVQGLRGRGRETERQRVRETKRWRERLPFLRFCCLSWCKTVPSITVLPSGAGKSTLTSALFRLVELDGGASSFDGVDLAGLGLWTVRRR